MSGICMGIALKRAGIESFVIVERSPAVGGTWWDNVYPGAQCDVRSHLYSFSFEPKPDWSRVFAPSQEIQAYVEHCVDRYDLRRHLRLGTILTSARYDPAESRWQLEAADGDSLSAQVFVCSVGPLNTPRLPAGIEAFHGKVMHSARWDCAYDFSGKRVALIGSAASAVQIAPPLAAAAASLTIFQRTPSWILPRPDRAYTRIEKALLRFPPLERLDRWWHYWIHDVRYAAFRGRGLLHRAMSALANRHRCAQVQDPALREALRPRYPMGCKRVLISSNFYPTFGRPNVELIASAASGFTADGIVSANGERRAVDAIVCATGFVTIDLLPGFSVRGAEGRTLAETTAGGAEAYRGTSVPGFPNLFLLLGPNTGTGHTSVLIAVEAQTRYIVKCIEELSRRGQASLEVRADVARLHNHDLQARLSRTVWASPACSSWYKTANGKIVALYPGHATRYRLEMRTPDFSAYRFSAGGAASGAGSSRDRPAQQAPVP